MTPLRQQMIDAMQQRGYSVRTHQSYLTSVSGLASYFHKSPDQLDTGHIQDYFVYLVKQRGLCERESVDLHPNLTQYLH